MNEPFLPLPLPSPPEDGIGPALAGAFGALSRTARRFVRWFRGIDIRDPLVRGDFHPGPTAQQPGEAVSRVRQPVGRKQPDPRLAARCRGKGTGSRAVRIPVLPPAEF